MRRLLILLLLGMLSVSGCGKKEVVVEEGGSKESAFKQETIGRLGDEIPISRAMAAKMVALAFDEKETTQEEISFSDVKEERWDAHYIKKAVALGFMSGEKGRFYPQRAITLQEAEKLVETLNPDTKSKIKVTEKTANVPISYSLWVELFQEALAGRRAEADVSSYGIVKKSLVILDVGEKQEILTTEGVFQAKGYGTLPFLNQKISVLEKDHEIVALLSLEEDKAHLENVFLTAGNGTVIVDTGFGKKNYPLPEGDSTMGEGVGNLLVAEGKVEGITFSTPIGGGVIQKVDEKGILLEGKGYYPWEKELIFSKTDEGIVRKSQERLIVGSNVADFYEKDGKLTGAMICRKAVPETIGVVLGNKEKSGYFQQKVSLFAKGGLVLKNGMESKEWTKEEPLVFLAENTSAFFRDGFITVESRDGSPIQVESLERKGKIPAYEGTLQLEKRQEGYVLVNRLPLERYLCGVLPFEMPVSFGIEPLKAQAITARSYAYNQYYLNRYVRFGANVDDSTACQVYGGVCTEKLVEDAVAQTQGYCLTYGNKVVSGNFYSTSCGVSANAGEVWASDGGKRFPSEGKPYLHSQEQGLEKEWGDFSQEETIVAFLKDGLSLGYDSNSPWYRWKTSFEGAFLNDVLENRLAQAFQDHPNLILVLDEDGIWRSQMPQALGKIKNMKVSSRGEGGNAMFLEIQGEKGQVRLATELVIREVLKPTGQEVGKTISLTLQDGSKVENSFLLPSGFFVLEQKKTKDGFLEGVQIHGGGNGHGVGMSQYGAFSMAEEGKTAEEILEHYFREAKVAKVLKK